MADSNVDQDDGGSGDRSTNFTVGAPRQLFEGLYGATSGIRSYDVTADGRRFLMVQQKERPAVAAAEMILVQNWLEELKARVPVK